MSEIDYKKEIEELILYAHHYYVLDNPICSDEEYDKLYHKVQKYENSKAIDNKKELKFKSFQEKKRLKFKSFQEKKNEI